MLYIQKISPPEEVHTAINKIRHSREWRQIPEGDTVAVRRAFDLLPKEKIRQTLIKEQHGLCAYCMQRISNDGFKMTIEHWYPLSMDKNKALEYSNMLGVCHGGRKGEPADRRILCCDASKGEQKITISPWNESHMNDIAYKRDGTIYTLSGNRELEEDINNRLHLNGDIDGKGNQIDTFTEIVKGRRNAVTWCDDFYRTLARKKKCTSAMIWKKIEEIQQADVMPEYAGVKLYFLKKKYKALVARNQ